MKQRRQLGSWAAVVVSGVGLAGTACSGGGRDSQPDNTATIRVAIKEAPADAGCLRLAATGSQNIVRTFPLTPGQSTIFTLGGLPPGPTVFGAEAFEMACASADFSSPNYVSDNVPVVLKAGSNGEITLTMRKRASIIVGVDFPGEGPGKWVSLDNSPPGTPAEVKLTTDGSSSASMSFFDVFIHGYFIVDRTGPDGQIYQHLTVPGLSTVGRSGAPDLPAVRLELAMLGMGDARVDKIEIFSKLDIPSIVPWPTPIAALDHENGEPEKFVKDDKLYAGTVPFPPAPSTAGPVRSKMGSIVGFDTEMFPGQWDPATKTLSLATHARFGFSHAGQGGTSPPMTKERWQAASTKFSNWSIIGTILNPNLFLFTGDFLFIYPPGYDNELLPLVNQKKSRGFSVTELTTATTGTTCASIRAAINAWYASTPSWRDKYAILVGDVATIPLCTAPTGSPTDDLYATTDGDNLDEEIYLGRLSVDNEADAANQVAKILQYSSSPELFYNYGTALLVAHKEDAPGKYVGAHESVRTASYSVAPTFSTLYGHIGGVDDLDVSDAINTGVGLVAYRGHGNSAAWTGWNLLSQYYDTADVGGLANAPTRVPVVWSFACNNNELGASDSIGETWMESTVRGVAHYGATVPSGTIANHELDRRMFKGVYDLGLTTHAKAIEYGETQMAAIVSPANAWMYLLLGDPEMRIRRGRVLTFALLAPLTLKVCSGSCELDVSVTDADGMPAKGVLVSLFKEGKGGRAGGDDVFDNRYTDDQGNAKIPASPKSPGTLHVAVRDLDGNGSTAAIIIQ